MSLELAKLGLAGPSHGDLLGRAVDGASSAQAVAGQILQPTVQDARLDLLYEVGLRASSASEVARLINEIVPMTKQALRAAASSVLLLDEEAQELYFEFADGDVGEALKQTRISADSGIAGWVAHNRKPIIVNNVAEDRRFFRGVDQVTGFVTRSIMCAPMLSQGRTLGVIEVLNKLDGSDFDGQDLEVLVSVASTAAMAIQNARLHEAVIDGYRRTVWALAAAIDAKDPYTLGHSQRVRQYALLAGKALSLPQDELEAIEYAGILHDVGKIGILDTTLRKPTFLGPDEWVVMRSHPLIGASIIGDVPFLTEARDLVLHHHERCDGTGYPKGLAGEEIPLGARLIAVADAFDTMTTDRAYRSALSVSFALHELHSCTGSQFCLDAVRAFVSGLEHYQAVPEASLQRLQAELLNSSH